MAVGATPPSASAFAAALLAAPTKETPAGSDPGAACLQAASEAQQTWQLPADILAAIGRVESGRYDPMLGRVTPWPWTINALGRGQYFATKSEAIEAVEALRASGVDTIDVGCFQVNLHYHPDAFVSLDEAFDPAANADYAARFLGELDARTGGWQTAVALYHSAWPEEGEAYRQKVMVSLGGGGLMSGGGSAGLFSRAPRRRLAIGDPYVILISSSAAAVRVYGPSGPIRVGPHTQSDDMALATIRPASVSSGRLRPFRLPPSAHNGLPTVVTPRTPI